jgi:hypothetical protein
MKKNFETPDVEVVELELVDVITTSEGGPDEGDSGLPIL